MHKSLAIYLFALLMILSLSTAVLAEGNYGGTLIWGRGGDSNGLDPICETDGESFKVTHQIFDTLVEYVPGTTKIQSALATSWSVGDDGHTWTFRLRKNVNFHDGTPFNAEAVKFNFDRWRLEDHPYHLPGEFKYYGYMFGADLPGVIEDVIVIDDYTIQFVLKEKFATFLANLAMVPFGISSPTAIEKWGEDYFTHPIGTGPFKFVKWIQGDRVIVEANQDYWNGRPYVDEIVFRSIPDNSARFMELQSGTVDIIDGVSPNDVQILKGEKDLELALRPSMNVGYFGLNQRFEPFKNVKVRRAIAHAIDKQAIIDAFYAGLAEPATHIIPPSMWGYNDEVKNYEYNPKRAKKLLAEAGYPDGFEMDLWAMPVPRPYMPQGKLIGQAIQQYLAEIGIKAKIVTYDWGTYLDKSREGVADSFLLGWTGDNGDPDNFIYVLLDKTNNDRHAYDNEELHQILVEAQQTFDQKERAALYKKALAIIHHDVPFVNLVHSTPPLGTKDNVENLILSPTGSEKLDKVWMK